MSKRITIIGGGIIGLCTAHYCVRRGHSVTLIDRLPAKRSGCSFGNAGMIVPSHFIPLAAPGMIQLGLKWMWNPESPFYIRPRMSKNLAAWMWKFRKSCTKDHVAKAAPVLRDLHLGSRRCYEELEAEFPDTFNLQKRGLLMLCKTATALEEEAHTAVMARELGVPAEVLSADATSELDPTITMDVEGSVYFPRDCHLSPDNLMATLQADLEGRDCEFLWDTEVTGFEHEGSELRAVVTNRGIVQSDEYILCGGIWSTDVANALDLNLPMQAGKGYSLTVQEPRELPAICSILTEARIAVTPMDGTLRFGGTMEIAGIDQSISPSRVRGIVKSIPDYFPKFQTTDFQGIEPWAGLRPCSPDGLPFIGRTNRWRNVIVSTGHAMMGLSLAPISGQIVSEMVEGQSPRNPAGLVLDWNMISPDRYG